MTDQEWELFMRGLDTVNKELCIRVRAAELKGVKPKFTKGERRSLRILCKELKRIVDQFPERKE